MALMTRIKNGMNQVLRFVNLRVETLTAERMETQRLRVLEASGYFDKPAFPVPHRFLSMDPRSILEGVSVYRGRFDDFIDPSRNEVQYSFCNPWFSSPDAEVLYTFIRKFRPRLVIEVGSGHSTKVIRQAIIDGGLNTQVVSVDPEPRIEVAGLVDEWIAKRVEAVEPEFFERLRENDVLFIDTSHEIKIGNDVVHLYLRVLPRLAPGVLIHIHDVFLPYEYPKEYIVYRRWSWNEQYLVQALLAAGDGFEVLWAGHYLQRTFPDFSSYFPHMRGPATSLWLRKQAQTV